MMSFVVPAADPTMQELALVALQAGQVIGIPTDTVYGIACDCRNAAAIVALYEAKGRPPQKALPVLLADEKQLSQVAVEIAPGVEELMRHFWPGALTLVVKAAPGLPALLTAGGATIAVRLPNHAVVRSLAAQLGHPLAVSSANLSGLAAGRSAAEVAAQMGARVVLILDGGESPGEQASTVLDTTTTPFQLLREGPVTREQLAQWL